MVDIGTVDKLERGKGKSQPLYLQVKQRLHKQIESGTLSVGEHLPAVSQMVNRFKVDYKTIGSALEILEQEGLIRCEPGRGKKAVVVRNSIRNSIKDSIKDSVKDSIKNGNDVRYECSIAFPRWCGMAQFVALAEGIEEFAGKNDIGFTATDAMQNVGYYLDAITHAPPDTKGLILLPWDTEEYRQAVLQAIESGLKIVFVDRVISGLDASSVTVDHFNGAYQATKHLIETHNCPVYYFGNTGQPSSAHQRYGGWLDAMREYKGQLDYSKYVLELPTSEAETMNLTATEWMQLDCEEVLHLFETVKENKYCILGMNDDTAAVVYRAAKKAGLQIGKDVYVVGFGDKPYCENLVVPLTSVAQFDKEVGYEAAKLLYNKIQGVQQRPVHKIVPARLKIRASSVDASVGQKDA